MISSLSSSFKFGLRLGTAIAAIGLAALAQAATRPQYRPVMSVPLGAPDRWDYVVFDPASARVFVAHLDRVTVVDGHSGHIVGQVEGMPGGTHGTAISAATGQGFTDDGEAGQAVAFDLTTLKVVKRIPAAPDADGIVTDPTTGHLFVADGDSGKVTAIDPATGKPLANIDLGGKLEGLDVDDRGRVFVAGAEKREVVVLGAGTNTILRRYPVPGCVSPHGVAADSAGRRLFVTCQNSEMLVLDSDTGKLVAALPIGRGSDAAAWDPKRKRAFSSNGIDGTISVIQQVTPNSYKSLAPIATQPSARTMAVDPATGRLFVAAVDLMPAATPGARPKPKPGSLRLLFFDPVS